MLDPTCGSGAFLFAALNILEPLYRASLDRMRALLGDWETRGEKHPNYRKEFTAILDQAARHPNENYFIFKSIIVHNLYGVDIMEEAVEICKLRLFLKLAAQLEPGQEIEPLPDIDFNIRSGNTLVGYASRDEVRRCMTQFGDGQMRLGVEDELQSYTRFEEAAENVDKAFQLFQQMQDDYGMNPAEFREQKRTLSRATPILITSRRSTGSSGSIGFVSPGISVSLCRSRLARPEKGGPPHIRGEVNSIGFARDDLCRFAHAWLNSSTYYIFFCAYTDTRYINPSDVAEFPVDFRRLLPERGKEIEDLSAKLSKCAKANTTKWRKSGLLIDSVDMKPCKTTIDEIDDVLAKHYGFTEEELDFIINYDIKYRMGLSGGSGEDNDE